ncbi:MAG TPA: penicillin-binding protein 2, partial [Actinomycetota bacterium]|nr:penicillin-binding protein 2 [Actinomycetota bacterium]
RMTALAAVIAFMFAALVTRLWFLQVLAAEQYRERAEGNYVRITPLAAPRGRILDRNGEPLVDNEPTIQVTVDKEKVRDEDALLARLSVLLDVPEAELRERYEDPDFLPHQPVPIWENVPEGLIYYLEEHEDEYPAVGYEVVAARRHVQGNLAPHVLGYLGQISPDELEDPSFSDYLPGQLVGRGGVEQAYEEYLRGKDGWLKQEIDAQGEIQGVLGVEAETPGNDLVLSIDRDIQALAEETMEEAVTQARSIPHVTGLLRATGGAVVVLDPNDGHVLAMASYPDYNPRIFLDGLSPAEFRELEKPANNFPLTNRAIAGQYPPGSTFKPFVAAAALRAGYASTNGFYPCPPEFVVPGDTSGTVFGNWTDAHLGTLSFGESLIFSCDTVFYTWGLDFYADRKARGELMQHQLRQWGFDEPTGIDIPGEQEGRIPNARWKQGVHAEYPNLFPEPTWLPGDNINMSIGQGDVLSTPLQVATAYAALANGGTLYRPQLALRVQKPDGSIIRQFRGERIGRVKLRPSHAAAINAALRGVVQGNGTAAGAFAGWNHAAYPVAGKTGTSEVNGKQPHSWFAAFAPADEPEFVVVAVVEEGGHGSQVAAPIVRRVLEGLLDLEPSAFRIEATETD